jgi:membrane protein YdbS with pleckstrin-like domain
MSLATAAHFETQEDDEQVVLLLRAHPITNIPWIASVVFLAVLGVVVFLLTVATVRNFSFSNLDWASLLIVWLLLLSGYALQRYLYWFFNVYIVTNKKLVDVDYFNLFYKRISETHLENIEDITHSVGGIVQNNFDFGNIHIQTAGTQGNFEFLEIPDPDGVQEKIMSLAGAAKKGTSG